jgi:hypothetical protein
MVTGGRSGGGGGGGWVRVWYRALGGGGGGSRAVQREASTQDNRRPLPGPVPRGGLAHVRKRAGFQGTHWSAHKAPVWLIAP